MNIFYLHSDPVLAAQMQVDKHVVKMTLETAQLLCSAFDKGQAPYRRTHYNHPCAKWVRQSKQNYLWLVKHGLALAEEYSYRYGKEHKSGKIIQWCLENVNSLEFTENSFSQPPQAMPVDYHSDSSVTAYRNYYKGEKAYLKSYKNREEPEWWNK
jgi:hypothetical protein